MLNWEVSLDLLVAELLFVIPLCSNLLLTYESPVGMCCEIYNNLGADFVHGFLRKTISKSIAIHSATLRIDALHRHFVSFFNDTHS